jgi:peptidoglycan/LPS O-acetylase OafA/YrhL
VGEAGQHRHPRLARGCLAGLVRRSRDPVLGKPAAWTLTCEAFFYAVHPFINRVLSTVALRPTFFIALGFAVDEFA